MRSRGTGTLENDFLRPDLRGRVPPFNNYTDSRSRHRIASSAFRNSMPILTAPVINSLRPVFPQRILRTLILGNPDRPHGLENLLKSAHSCQRQNLATNRVMAPQLDGYFKQVDKLSESFIERLGKAVSIPSVSADAARRPDVVKVSFLSNLPH